MKKVLLWLFSVTLVLTIACLPQTGTVDIKSVPSGADIFLDDSLTGAKTNCVLEDIPFGRHELRLALKSYVDWKQEIDIDEKTPFYEATAELFIGNNAPEIKSVTASANNLNPNQTTLIQASARDSDGDSLTFEWFSVNEEETYTGSSFTWKAPSRPEPRQYEFFLTVSDGKGGTVYDSSLVVTVKKDSLKAVTLLSATDISTTRLTLTWSSSDYGMWYCYEIYRSVAPDTTIGSLIEVKHSQTDTTLIDASLNPGTGYYYVVAVVDSNNELLYSNRLFASTDSFTLLGTQGLGGGHGLRLANIGDYIFCSAREKNVLGFGTDFGLYPGAAIPAPNANPDACAYDLCLPANLMHVAFGKEGYHAYTTADPYSPEEVASVDAVTLGGEARAIYASGSTIFIGCTNPATSTNTIVCFDFNDATLHIDTLQGIPEGLTMTDNYIYIAEGNAGLEILRWTPSTDDPVQHVSIFPTADAAHDLFVSDHYAYVAAGAQGLLVVDITNPKYPQKAAKWVGPQGSDTRGLYISGTTAYLADGVYGLRVLDICSPTYPKFICTLKVGALITDVWVRSRSNKTQAILSDWSNAIYMIEW